MLQILRALHLEDYGWANHPAVTMWRGHTLALIAYGLAMVAEWLERGYSDTTAPQIAEFARPGRAPTRGHIDPRLLPPWWGSEALHRSHRAALLRKDPEVYAALDVADPDEPYVWPPPPKPPEAPRPFTAWVVRAATPVELKHIVSSGLVTLPDALAEAQTPKQRRQRRTFAEAVQPGDPIAVSDGAALELGTVAGPPGQAEPHSVRAVTFTATLARTDLLRPWQLQDPKWLSRLRGEEAVLESLGVRVAE